MTLPNKHIEFRLATPEDVALLRHWDKKPHVLAADPNDDWQWETELLRRPKWREQLIAQEKGRSIGFVQIIDPAKEDSHYWGDIEDHLRAIDIWIGEESDLGQGYGNAMMDLALTKCFKPPQVLAVLVDPLYSNTRSHRFYERFGFAPVGPRQLRDDYCLIYRLSRDTWKSRTTAC